MKNLLGRLKTNRVGHTHYVHIRLQKTTKITSTNSIPSKCTRKKQERKNDYLMQCPSKHHIKQKDPSNITMPIKIICLKINENF